MALCEDVARYGAKGASLKHIRDSDPSIPIEPFVLVPVGEDWRTYHDEIRKLGRSLVRSSSPVEDGERLSFAGLFATTPFLGEGSVEDVLGSAWGEDALTYASHHGVTLFPEMGLVFHAESGSQWNWGMLRHPHRPEIVFIQGRPVCDTSRYSENLVLDERTGELQEVNMWAQSVNNPQRREPEQMPDGILQALEAYRKIEALPGFRTGHTYHMEFGTHPFSVYQFRPFRKQEIAQWELDVKSAWQDDGMLNDYGLAFGITPPEGIELTVARAFAVRDHEEHIERYRKLAAKGTPRDTIVKRLIRHWGLRKPAHPYAEEVAKIPVNSYGCVEEEAFDRALSRMNYVAQKDKTCIFQESMHFYYGRDIDLVFPNAKAWIGNMGLEFLSHNWFRAAQSYDIALIGGSIYSKSGQKVRVYSDGVRGLVTRASGKRAR